MGDGAGISLELGHRAAVLSAQHACAAGSQLSVCKLCCSVIFILKDFITALVASIPTPN